MVVCPDCLLIGCVPMISLNGLQSQCIVDSVGTHHYHVGKPPHKISQKVCHDIGLDISGQKSRQVAAQDFEDYDLILAMDEGNV